MLKKIKRLSEELSKLKSQWKEAGEKLEERELLSKDAAAMLNDFIDRLDQYFFDSNKRITDIQNVIEFQHLTGEASKRHHFSKDQVTKLEIEIIEMPIENFSSYEISSKFYHLKKEFKDLVNSTHFTVSDENFNNDLEKITKEIEEKINFLLDGINKSNKSIVVFEKLRHEIKDIFWKLCFHYGENYNIRNEKDIDILNLHIRLVEIKEMVGVLPHNSIDNKFLQSLRDKVLCDQKV